MVEESRDCIVVESPVSSSLRACIASEVIVKRSLFRSISRVAANELNSGCSSMLDVTEALRSLLDRSFESFLGVSSSVHAAVLFGPEAQIEYTRFELSKLNKGLSASRSMPILLTFA